MCASAQPAQDAGKTSRRQILNEVWNSLAEVRAPGSFAALKEMPSIGTVGLEVEGVGNIHFPLQEEQARQLIALSRQAPFGRGSETVVDTSVRNTWELDASKLRFGDCWNSVVLQPCLDFVKEALDIRGLIRAEPYKMLIYEKGAMFKAHTDTEKIPNMFGTLVICLPSPHEGGDVIATHRGQTEVLRTSEAQPSALCWYSDVHHEVLPVKSGYRWVLTYNLAVSPSPAGPPTAAQGAESAQLRDALQTWLQHEAAEKTPGSHLYYLLDHAYTDASISLNALKGDDLARMERLRHLSSELGFDILLAVLHKNEYGMVAEYSDSDAHAYDSDDNYVGPWHDIEEYDYIAYAIRTLVDLDGNKVRRGIGLDYKSFVDNLIPEPDPGSNPFHDSKDTQETFYLGNEGAQADHIYSISVAVLLPRESADAFLFQEVSDGRYTGTLDDYYDIRRAREEVETLQSYFVKRSRCGQTRKLAVESLMHLIKTSAYMQLIKPPTNKFAEFEDMESRQRKAVMEVVSTALELREYSLFECILELINIDALDATVIGSSVVGGSVDFGELKQSLLDYLFKRNLPSRSGHLRDLLISSKHSHDGIKALAAEVTERSLADVQAQIASNTVLEEDGLSLVDMIFLSKDDALVESSMLPLVQLSTTLLPFALGVRERFTEYASRGSSTLPNALGIAKDVTKVLIDALDVALLRSEKGLLAEREPPRQWYDDTRPSTPTLSDTDRGRVVSETRLSSLFADCITNRWEDLLEPLSQKLISQADSIPPTEFVPLWIPFLRQLLDVLEKASVPLDTPRYRRICVTILEGCLERFVQREPVADLSWAKPALPCNCLDCSSLNTFLTSSTANEYYQSQPYLDERREHLEAQLEIIRHSCDVLSPLNSWSGRRICKKMTKPMRDHVEWTKRFKEAEAAFGQFGEFDARWRTVLGADYDRIVGMQGIRL